MEEKKKRKSKAKAKPAEPTLPTESAETSEPTPPDTTPAPAPVPASSPPKTKWSSQAKIQNDIILRIRRMSANGSLETIYPFFDSLRVYRPYKKDRDVVLLVSGNKEVSVLTDDDLNSVMLEWYQEEFMATYENQVMTTAMEQATTHAIMPYLQRLEKGDIKIFAFKSEDLYCWRKLDWNLQPAKVFEYEEPWAYRFHDPSSGVSEKRMSWEDTFIPALEEHAPAWWSIIRRLSNQEAVVAWLGSLMDREADNHQFLLVRGDGGDGKGTMLRALMNIFGEELMYAANIPEEAGARRFFKANLEGKRILCCPDYPDSELFTDILKSLTGGDPLDIERKGEQGRMAENHLKTLIFTNFWLHIPNTEAARRRVILSYFIEQLTAEHRIDKFEERLLEEKQLFFSIALHVYRNMHQPGNILQDVSVYDHNFDNVRGDDLELLDNFFHLPDPNDFKPIEGKRKEIKQIPYMLQCDFTMYVKQVVKDYTPAQVREIISGKVKGAGEVHVVRNEAGKPERRVVGIEPKKVLTDWKGANSDRKPMT